MASRSYRTKGGTELPLMNLKGKEYLEVKYRVLWFREEHPNWAITTELLSVTDDAAYAKASIIDDQKNVLSTSHKFETKRGFADFIEKAETGAIGRALALIGYGTQFCADEMDEGSRIVDSPITQSPPTGTRYPARFPEHLAGRFIESFNPKELVDAEVALMTWKTGKQAKTFPVPVGDEALNVISNRIKAIKPEATNG